MKPFAPSVIFVILGMSIWGFGHYMTEGFVLECHRGSAAPADAQQCVVRQRTFGGEVVHDLGSDKLLSVRTDIETRHDADGYINYYRFVVLTPDGELRSGSSLLGVTEMREAVNRVNEFRADKSLKSVTAAFDNTLTYNIVAGFTVLLAAFALFWRRN